MMTGGLTKEEESAGSSLFSGLKDENATDIPIKWDEVADVVIIGSGFAGLAAAIDPRGKFHDQWRGGRCCRITIAKKERS